MIRLPISDIVLITALTCGVAIGSLPGFTYAHSSACLHQYEGDQSVTNNISTNPTIDLIENENQTNYEDVVDIEDRPTNNQDIFDVTDDSTEQSPTIVEGYIEDDMESEVEDLPVEAPVESAVTEVDYSSFNASYNLLAATAQLEMGKSSQYKTEWSAGTLDECSAAFVSWCSKKIGYDEIVPMLNNAQQFKKFYEENGGYYKANGCAPTAGDLVLLDMDQDGVPDCVRIVALEFDTVLQIIGMEQDGEEIVVRESKMRSYDSRIVGFCRPDYNISRFVGSYPKLTMNALDTVSPIKSQEHADLIASYGVEVIARYINPEGRTPLTVEEAQLYFNAGIRVMMIYEFEADDPYQGYEKGVEIGKKALEYARNLGAPKGTPIFYCCDCQNMPGRFSDVAAFILGVKDAMEGEYGVGLYGGFYVTEAMYNMGLIDAYWQCWGYSDSYVSQNYDMIQYASSSRYITGVPYLFDANHVKDPEKVSYFLPSN